MSEGLLQGFTQLFSGVLTIAATLGILFYINWIVALVVLVLTPLSLFVAAFITRRSHSTFAAQAVKRGEISGYVEEIFTGRNLIQAFCQENLCQKDFEKLNKELYDCGFKCRLYFRDDSGNFIKRLCILIGIGEASRQYTCRKSFGRACPKRYKSAHNAYACVYEIVDQKITRTSLRDSYGMVLQDSWLFKGSIKDNIAYGKQDASLEEIIKAAQLAGVFVLSVAFFDILVQQ